MMTAVAADDSKPWFVGEINGIEFIDDGSFPEIEGCPRDILRELTGAERGSAIPISEIYFDAYYLPNGSRVVGESATDCEGILVGIGRLYESSDSQRPLSIVRTKGPAVYPPVAPVDRMEAVTFGERRGVLVKPRFDGDEVMVFLEDEAGTNWAIVWNPDLDVSMAIAEVSKIAEALQTRH
jgi:hypothetical protein